ncbi:MAG: hypothetical protein IKK24_04440, partial [Clostridia bacterium]|nr:hypothetical protein [Clostridia bacterium]
EKNLRAVFRTYKEIKDGTYINVATSCVYSLYVNGKFVAFGPARSGRNHFRIDKIDLSAFKDDKKQLITLEVQHYGVNSFCLVKQPPFLQAELITNNVVTAFTGGKDFAAGIDGSLVRKLQRFSFQRPFVEGYILNPQSYSYRTDPAVLLECETEILEEKTIIERNSPYPIYERVEGELALSGQAFKKSKVEYTDTRSYTGICDKLEGFLPEELTWHVSRELQDFEFKKSERPQETICSNEYSIYSFPVNYAGFLHFNVEVKEKTVLYVLFDEVLIKDDINILHDECCRAVKYELEAGSYDLKFFEPQCMMFAKFFVSKGNCTVSNVSIIGYNHPPIKCSLEGADDKQKLLIKAAINSFRGNAVDLFTDCPSRERAGWLCDSFFVARTEKLLTGENRVEKDFLLNFLHEDEFKNIHKNIVPMCYPADHLDGVYIPNWALWLILELKDYLRRSGDKELIEQFRKRVFKIIDFHIALLGKENLLERIPEGVFVEWSHANEMVQEINFPSNMLFVAALHSAAELYGQNEWPQIAEKIKKAVIKYSYIDGFFCDRANLDGDKVCTVKESSEVCQYYAFLFGIADKDSYPELYSKLISDFSPDRRVYNKYPEICFAELFIGIPLRIEMLLKYGLFSNALNEILFYFLCQASLTGTFWEGLGDGCSRNHGFGSVVADWLNKINKQETSFLW